MKTKSDKQEEAKARQEKYDKLSTGEKLAKIDRGGWRAEKERAKLLRLMKEEDESLEKSRKKTK